ncbi:MAG: hypothetical protein EP147_19675 [Subdoligranulum sp.]|nr:hypothetical protein [Subdoligranulum sp.]
MEQEYTNSVENLKTTAYVGGEEKEGVTRKVAEVGGSSTGLSRDEVFINATDIVQEYENESGQTVTLTDAQYLALLRAALKSWSNTRKRLLSDRRSTRTRI